METDILKYILDNQGAVITSDLLFNLCNTSTLSEILCKNDKFVTCLLNGTPKIVVRSAVRLCWRKDCPGCGALHLCKSFLLTDSCQYTYTRRGCIFSHDLCSGYNKKILTEFGLETLSRAQLCLLLLQSNNNLLPSICHNYNNRNGCGDTCLRLHVCEKFLSSDCSCFRTHDFLAPQPLKLLQDKRIPSCLFGSLKSVYANKQALWLADKLTGRRNGNVNNDSDKRAASSLDLTCDNDNNQDSLNSCCDTDSNTRAHNNQNRGRGGRELESSDSNVSCTVIKKSDNTSHNPKQGKKGKGQGQKDKTEICMFFIKGHCKYEDRCFKAHVKMPYLWEISVNGKWTPMADNEKIEKAYCDPENTYSTCPPVYFDTMKSGKNAVRRLSTINSVLEPNFIHTTDWLWYWEDDNGKWLQYGANTSVHQLASVTSKYLEEMYVKNDKAVIQFKAGSQSYELNFQDMIQINIKYGTKRHVRRRPQFVSAAEVPTKRKRTANTTAVVPDYWDKTQISPTEHRCISLQPSLAEYKEIHDLFCQTMKGFDILKIERIQNKAVWEAFQLQKNQMKDKNNGQPVAEKKLFHGTDPSHVETICATNFDWRVCGVNGTIYGQGSYFARDAKYSHSYTGTSLDRFMFVSRVLIGEYTRGSSEYRRPPSKDGSNVNLYDSCVDDVMNPSIFVVFEKQQIYPEYVLQYRERAQQTTYHQPAAVTVVPPTTAVTVSVTSVPSTVSLNPLVTVPATTSSPGFNKSFSNKSSHYTLRHIPRCFGDKSDHYTCTSIGKCFSKKGIHYTLKL
ncbi:protein mono-ADP-ribosyltransferase PARP12-like isoform X2 [Boleophthalmus pectinirostris]|uniref:protein mono-ADP-ribosyltransferase PARP12-like isoform X2 n=1 Tax=Boleophthalmus pectinirostris TaxID=150288 RepID=UPI0024314D22|nr:protein mono-ADP-ribosyltransferase PARP12-like isoform X2 [Boleophthalmus pectinirostris]